MLNSAAAQIVAQKRDPAPPVVPRRGSPRSTRRQVAGDNDTPPSLPPKKQSVLDNYAEVSVGER